MRDVRPMTLADGRTVVLLRELLRSAKARRQVEAMARRLRANR